MVGINTSMSKEFRPTYLYVKTHNVTGLKYFGKTTKSDPHKYLGSGTYWLEHIKIHGNSITTEIIGLFTDKDDCRSAAVKFSRENNIIHALNENGKKIWANLVMENGLDGGDTGRTNYGPLSDSTKEKISTLKKGKKPWNTGLIGVNPGNRNPRTQEQKEKISKKLSGRKRSTEAIEKTAEKLKGRKRPDISIALKGKKKSQETIDKMKLAQQNKGPVSEETKQKIREARKFQVFSDETKQKLQGKIVCINKLGEIKKIDKEIFYSQEGVETDKEWVFHLSKVGLARRQQ
jgi:hypothetical protein